MDFTGARIHILDRLRNELNPLLTYHTVEHTLDMHRAAIRLMDMEKFDDERERLLIETAAVYHDAGMMVSYNDHETQSVLIAGKTLPSFGYSLEEIDEVAGLILVTRLPQMPSTLPEKILCDADLDSLGRDDFFIQSFQLQLEWKLNGIAQTTLEEWLRFEVKFFNSHEYFTKSGRELRQEQKRKNLLEIENILGKLK
ncbi:MAG: HD domain-containing protein [Bacteroidetes bacterium]|nr:HD domain-containing protein [Bacteroidota bacterium]